MTKLLILWKDVRLEIRVTNGRAQIEPIFIKDCLRDAGPTTIEHPEFTKAYCACAMDEIMIKISKEQYAKSLLKSQEEEVKEILSLFQNCVTELKQRIEKVEKKQIEVSAT